MPSDGSTTYALRIRLLGTASCKEVSWKAAGLLGWPDTFDAEYVALTQLHADALITLDLPAPSSPLTMTSRCARITEAGRCEADTKRV
jgi:hypothetical protein